MLGSSSPPSLLRDMQAALSWSRMQRDQSRAQEAAAMAQVGAWGGTGAQMHEHQSPCFPRVPKRKEPVEHQSVVVCMHGKFSLNLHCAYAEGHFWQAQT